MPWEYIALFLVTVSSHIVTKLIDRWIDHTDHKP
jgi:hypothetical protein